MPLSEDTAYSIMFREIVSINRENLKKIVASLLDKIAILCLGYPKIGHYFFLTRMVTFTGLHHMRQKFLNTKHEYNLASSSSASKAHIHVNTRKYSYIYIYIYIYIYTHITYIHTHIATIVSTHTSSKPQDENFHNQNTPTCTRR
jgi:hypothetical protein